jgi:CheY-like chemotaxis protein
MTKRYHRRALIVSSDAHCGQVAANLCELEGLETYTALDGPEALGCGADIQPDFVLVDIATLESEGYAVASAMRATNWGKAATFVALTGDSAPATRDRCIDVGFDHHLVQPIDYRELARSLLSLPKRVGDEPFGILHRNR